MFSNNMTVNHNTSFMPGGLITMFDNYPKMVGLDFKNNIADMGTYGVSGTGTVGGTLATLNTWWTNWTFTHSAIGIIGEDWNNPPGNFFPSNHSAVDFVN